MKLLLNNQITGEDKASRYCRDYSNEKSIKNIFTKMMILDVGAYQLPCTLNEGVEAPKVGINSYVISQKCAYVDYCLVELKRLNKPLLSWPLGFLVKLMSMWVRSAKIDQMVQINNWMLSTNIYPSSITDSLDVKALRDLIEKQYPKSAIVFRSLNSVTNSNLKKELLTNQFIAVASRQVYFFDAREGNESRFRKKHNCELDDRLLKKMPYALVDGSEFTSNDFCRAEELYNFLYIEKYCQHNPRYTADWLMAGQKSGWLRLKGLRNNVGILEGVVGWFENEEVITAPIVGYNTQLPSQQGLYRLLTQLCLQEACRTRKLLNFSSGAAEFKRLRGGEPVIEYSMVYVNHLTFFRRMSWRLIALMSNGIGVPLMKRWKL